MKSAVLHALFDSMMEGIYVLNGKGDYLYANASYLKMCRGDKQDLDGLNAYDLVKKGYVTESAGVKALTEKRRISMVNRVNNLKGYQFHQVITATPVFSGDGSIQYVFCEVMNLHLLNQCLRNAYQAEGGDLRIRSGENIADDDIVSASSSMQGILALADIIAEVDSTVMITGESGTGKDVLAHYIHEHSSRADRPMLTINCASIPESLIESELFGYVKGAFTGALQTGKEGLISQANKGTLFIDEINSIPMPVQTKLLRVLEQKRIMRIGSLEEEEVDFRLIVAANKDLKECIKEGAFRSDLYYRLSVVPIEIPPLRERTADILPLAWKFIDRYCRQYDRNKILTSEALAQLLKYDWPGNVRELKNVIERMVVTSSPDTFEISQLPEGILKDHERTFGKNDILDWEILFAGAPDQFSLKRHVEEYEMSVIEGAIKKCGNIRAAAKFLKIDHSTLVRKRQKYRMHYAESDNAEE